MKYMENGGLARLVEIEEPAYRELTLEFLATFSHNKKVVDPNEEGKYSFRLMGHFQTPSLNNLNQLLGFIDDEDINSEEYKSQFTEVPKDFDMHEFGHGITGEDNYDGSSSKSSAIADYSLRYMHKIITNTLFARTNQATVPQADLTALWSMTTGRKMNLGYWFGEYMTAFKDKHMIGIFCGSLITRIAEAIGLFRPTEHKLTLENYPEKLDLPALQYMQICKKTGGKWYLFHEAQKIEESKHKKRKAEPTLTVSSEENSYSDGPKTAEFYKKCAELTPEEIMLRFKEVFHKCNSNERDIKQLKKENEMMQTEIALMKSMLEAAMHLIPPVGEIHKTPPRANVSGIKISECTSTKDPMSTSEKDVTTTPAKEPMEEEGQSSATHSI
ncbi:hypothetical protein M5689_018946 [Euphorbia peplus]|nr:hypothetical protein M5689_018946 [Euphorbia peplus]